MRTLTFQTGITALLVATATLLALGVLFPALPLTTCTEVGYAGVVDGPALYALEGSEVVYTPDGGITECSTHAAVPGVPAALLALGAVLVGASVIRR